MKRIRNFFDEHTYFSILVIISMLVLILQLTRGIVFETVDDYNVMFTLAGYKTGNPYYQLTFFNTFFAFLISLLYRVTGIIQWYSIIHLTAIVMSISSIMYVVLKISEDRELRSYKTILLFTLYLIIACLYPVQRLQFTTTAALLGSAAVAYAMLYNFNAKYKTNKILTLSCLYMFMCFLMRGKVGMSMLCFWTLAMMKPIIQLIAFKIFNQGTKDDATLFNFKKIRKGFTALILVFAVISVVRIGDQYLKNNFDNKGYLDYNKYRTDFQDYNPPEYTGNEDLYNNAGWDESTYDIVKSLIYMEDDVNSNTFKSITDSLEYKSHNSIRETLSNGKQLILKNDEVLNLTIFSSMLLVAVLFSTIKSLNSESTASVLISILASFGAFILVFYLCMRGRVNTRTFQMIALPTITILLIEYITVKAKNARKELILIFASFLLTINTVRINRTFIAKDNYSNLQMSKFEEYAINHPEQIFIHDYSISNVYNSYNPFVTYNEVKPTNVIISGGSYTYSGAYERQLEYNNLNSITGETLMMDNVYYVCDIDKSTFLNRMLTYMSEHGYTNEVKYVEILEGNAAVFKFTKSVDSLFTGVTTIGDQLYMFKDGKVQHGEFLLDGVVYKSKEIHELINYEKDNESYRVDTFGSLEVRDQ